MKALWKWFTRLLSGQPHFRIGGDKSPYLLRWFLIPRNPWFNVYLHKFLRDDEDRALHCHPWKFVSVMIRGRYSEVVGDEYATWMEHRSAPSIVCRAAEHRHRVILEKNTDGTARPCWTIVLTGPNIREWGFWCPKGFVPWRQFVDERDEGNIGKGCGE